MSGKKKKKIKHLGGGRRDNSAGQVKSERSPENKGVRQRQKRDQNYEVNRIVSMTKMEGDAG